MTKDKADKKSCRGGCCSENAGRKYEEFMALAIDKAREGVKNGQTPFGACIVKKNGEVVAVEHNRVWDTTDITAHAEVVAIRQACKNLKSIDLSDCIIFSTCEPCPMCFAACHWAGLEQIVYGARIADAQAAGFRELTLSNRRMKTLGKSHVEIVPDFMRKDCSELFGLWLKTNKSGTY